MGQTKNNRAAENLAANRNYKSTVFAMLFGDREICQRTALVGGSGTCHHRVYPGRNPERISGEEPGGGEENEYIRIRPGKTYPNGEAGRLGGWSTPWSRAATEQNY